MLTVCSYVVLLHPCPTKKCRSHYIEFVEDLKLTVVYYCYVSMVSSGYMYNWQAEHVFLIFVLIVSIRPAFQKVIYPAESIVCLI